MKGHYGMRNLLLKLGFIAFMMSMADSAIGQYSSQFLKNRQQQRQIARAIELQQSRARTKKAMAKISRHTVVRTNSKSLRRRVSRRR